MRFVTIAALAGLVWLPACGGGSPTTPAAPTPAPASLTIVSAETEAPVAGASVTVAGRALSSDASGRVQLPERPPTGAFVDVVAAGFLDRQTLFRSGTTQLSLWPRVASSGLTEDFTANVVYTSASAPAGGPVGESPLERLRPGVAMATLVATPEILGDRSALRALEDAAGQVGMATQGAIAYVVSGARPGAGTSFDVRVDPGDALCRSGQTRAYFRGRFVGDEIIGGQIVFCSLSTARTTTAAHEVGHSLGLQHSNASRDLMFGTFVRGRATSLTPREGLTVRLMLQRRGGNRFPDNDRGVTVSGARSRVTVCE